MRAVAAVALASLWVTAGAHCLLASMPGFSFLRCHDPAPANSDRGSHCGDQACLTLESGLYVSAAQAKAPAAALGMLVQQPAFVESLIPPDVTGGVLTSVPPDLPKIWQFTLRTALRPRAPSLVV